MANDTSVLASVTILRAASAEGVLSLAHDLYHSPRKSHLEAQ